MGNLIKSDIYKLTKAKYFWICVIINILLAAGTIFLLDFSYKMTAAMPEQVQAQSEAMQESGLNISSNAVPKSLDDLSLSSQFLTFFAGANTILIAVLISLFVGGEFTYGTIKNLATKNYSRGKIYTSKLVVSILIAIVFTLLYALVASLTAGLLWGVGDFGGSFVINALKGGAIELLLVSSLASLFTMFSMMVRQNGASIAVNICVLEFATLIVMLGEMLAKQLFDKSVTLSNYLVDTNMQQIATQELTSKLAIRSILVGLAFFIVPAVIGYFNFKKRDIK